jgi:hypothetical protein
VLLPYEREIHIKAKLYLTNIIQQLVARQAQEGLFEANITGLTGGFITLLRNKLKLVIYMHNGDVRNIVKYYCKHKKMARDFIEFVEELVEQNRETEGNYIRICNDLASEINNYQGWISESVEDYMDFKHNSDLSQFLGEGIDVFA